VLALLDAAIFNLIVGNADAHGKNFSLLYHQDSLSLAPFYDLVSTIAYPDLSPKLAMKIAKRATLEEIGQQTWADFAEDLGLGAPFVRRRVRELADAVRSKAPGVAESITLPGLDAGAVAAHAALVAARAERVGQTSPK
jgi:serine/threonine-protein kinase HipA